MPTDDSPIRWDDTAIVAIDQSRLPQEYRMLRLRTVDELIEAIQHLRIRGAPVIGAAGALGVALAAHQHTDRGVCDHAAVRADGARIAAARPTAVNLSRAVNRTLATLPEGRQAILDEALAIVAEDEKAAFLAAESAADVILDRTENRPLKVLTHCNTGGLAALGWGSALGAIRVLAHRDSLGEVFVGETRPLLQGSRLTTWELARAGIPHRLCVDSAGPVAIALGMVDCVVVGADRITANGDVANKIGTYALAVVAARHNVPFVVVAPESTIDDTLSDGRRIVIEQRAPGEVTEIAGQRVATEGVEVFNPAFDVTPAELIGAIVTNQRVITGPNAMSD